MYLYNDKIFYKTRYKNKNIKLKTIILTILLIILFRLKFYSKVNYKIILTNLSSLYRKNLEK